MPGTDNSAALLAARRAVSAEKRQAVIDTVREMLRTGVPITFSAVARRAGVSAGLVHASALKSVISDSMTQQRAGGPVSAGPVNAASRVSVESLQQDLALARNEVDVLRKQNALMTERIRRDLGAQVQTFATRDAAARIGDLEERNRTLVAAEAAARADAHRLQALNEELREDLESSRAAHGRLMRQVNGLPQASSPSL